MSAHTIAGHRDSKQPRSDRLVVLLLFKAYISIKHVKTKLKDQVLILFLLFTIQIEGT